MPGQPAGPALPARAQADRGISYGSSRTGVAAPGSGHRHSGSSWTGAAAPRPGHRHRAVPARPGVSQLDAALARADAAAPARLHELAAWLAIPSTSGQPHHRADLRRAARFLRAHLRQAGAITGQLATGGAPVVIGCAAGPPGAPVVVVYGHYDVQPAGPGWTSAAFRPSLQDGALVARGANDDKGQLFAVVAALRAWHEAGGVPSTVLVIAEGAEEIGSPGLRGALAAIARRVRPDVVLACDTEQAAGGVPAVTISQRGHADLLVRVDTGGGPVHAGRLGGAVIDPSLVLAEVLRQMQASLARTQPSRRPSSRSRPEPQPGAAARHAPEPEPEPEPGGRVGPVSGRRPPSVRGSWPGQGAWADRGPRLSMPPRVQPDYVIRRLAGGRATRCCGLDRKITAGPSLTVARLTAGTGRAAVPARAAARLDVRVPARTDVRTVVARLARAARQAAPPGVAVQLTVRTASPGFSGVPRPEVLAAADIACRAVYGRPLALVRSGGSLPAARLLGQAFGLVPVLLGLGTPGGGAHGPDEHLDVAGWVLAVRLITRLFARPVLAPPVLVPPDLARPAVAAPGQPPRGPRHG